MEGNYFYSRPSFTGWYRNARPQPIHNLVEKEDIKGK